jgi:mono/diheme cytochrome c family protein
MKNPMTKGLLILGLVAGTLLTGRAAANEGPSAAAAHVTFNKDVLPILQNNCQACHRAGEVAPMSLGTFQETRPWAAAIKSAVLSKKMPPWFADSRFGHFANERRLTPEEIKTLVKWVDEGAPEGDPKDRPAPVHFVEGWNIGHPDIVLEMPNAYPVPAEGTVDYQYMVIPGKFKEDTWITAAEVRPGNRAVVHHVIAFVRPPGSQWLKDAEPGVPVSQGRRPEGNPEGQRAGDRREGGIVGSENLTGYAPGLQPLMLNDGSAKLIPAGSDIVLQLHYTANGTATADKTKVGLIVAKNPPKYRNLTMLAPTRNFVIPPNADNYEVKSQVQLQETVTLVDMMPHMHFRGKDFRYEVIYPDGQTQTLLSVPKYDFNWQLGYMLEKPLVLPKGTRIECTAHFDNSPNNPYNPDPTKEVRWGDQTWEEMMIGWFSVAVDPKATSAGLVRFEKPGTRPDAGTKQNGTPQPSAEPGAKTGAPSGSGSF